MARSYKPHKKGDKLTPQQEKWIDEYLKCGDYTQASKLAGYKAKNNNNYRTIGWQNSLKFKELIEERRAEISKQMTVDTIATLTDIYTFWTNVFTDSSRKIQDRLKASELLAKAKGAFVEKVEVKEIQTDWFIDE